jgi:hypothetical protein
MLFPLKPRLITNLTPHGQGMFYFKHKTKNPALAAQGPNTSSPKGMEQPRVE